MKKKLLSTIKHPLVSGSLVMFFGGGLTSVLNFIFNIYMSRNLTVADYGILASLLSVLSLAMVIASSGIPMVVNFAASYFARNDLAHVRGLFIKSTLYYFCMGIIILFFFIIFPKQISNFFHITQVPLLTLCGIAIFINFIGTINMSFLQAKLAFRYITVTNFISTFIKLSLGILLFMLGFGVSGAMWALAIGFLTSYILTFYPLRFVFRRNLQTPQFNMKELLKYGIPAAIASLAVTSFISTDIILVKHFFPPDVAGVYAGLSLVGRVVYFLTAPITLVMFPLIAQKHAKNESYDGTFLLAFLIILIPSVALTLFYFLFPELSIEIFIKKKEYLQAAHLVGLFGVFITVYSLLSVFTNFYLSIKKTKIWIPILCAAFAQVIFIWLFHNNFFQVISISLIVTFSLLLFFTFYYFKIRANSRGTIAV